MLAQQLLTEIYARKIEKASIPNILEKSFDRQRNFIWDKERLKALFCTRRSSKSFTAGLYLCNEALHHPNSNCLFIGLTRDSAKRIIWKDILRVINDRYNLGARFNQADLTMTLPNGSVITVTGIDAAPDDMNKLLGAKYRVVCIDEASMYTVDVRNLVYGVLGPAMVDPNDDDDSGTICLMGTASNFPRGLFYDITTGKEKGWSLHSWTAKDNPFVAKKWQENLEKIERERPEYMSTPQFKQWYLNQWVVDEEKLVYRFDLARNLTGKLPALSPNGWSYVLGIDTGWEDASAIVLTAYHLNDPNLYVVRSFVQKKLTFDQLAEIIANDFMKDPLFSPHKIIIDGANKQGVESMRSRYHIPFEYADKRDKETFIELCNADMRSGKILIQDNASNRPLWEEMSSLVWMTDGDKIRTPKKEHPSLSNHLCDAFLYAWRCGYHYTAMPAAKKIVVGSREWYMQQSDEIWEREREHIERQHEWAEEGSLGELG